MGVKKKFAWMGFETENRTTPRTCSDQQIIYSVHIVNH